MVASAFPEGSTRASGYLGESYAADFLQENGLEICARNIMIAGAEIDLIARIPATINPPVDTIVFVEVRSRDHEGHGSPLETIQPHKMARLKRAATAWLIAQKLWEEVAVRFDVIGLVKDDHIKTKFTVQWIQAAFDAD